MSFIAVLVAVALSQTPEAQPAPSAAPVDPADRAAAAAERTAVAAEKTAAAASRIADLLAPEVKAGAAAEKKPEHWKGTLGLGFTFLIGNAQMLTLTGNVAADRAWGPWSMAIRAAGAYGVSNPTANVAGSDSQTTARKAAGTVRGDRAFGSFASLFLLGGGEFDHVKNVEAREFGEAGTGLTLLNDKQGDRERFYLRADLAMRAGYETRVQYFPAVLAVNPYAVVILAPRGALTLRWAPNEYVRFSEEVEAIPFLLQPNFGRLLFNSTTKLNAKVTENVSLSAAFVFGYDSTPPPTTPAKLSTDISMTAGIEAAF